MKFVALFMFAFLVFDVCAPEPCENQASLSEATSVRASSHQSSGNSEGCQFEEDCFNCAHFAPGHAFVLEPIAVVAFTDSDWHLASLDGTPLLPYHPPRA